MSLTTDFVTIVEQSSIPEEVKTGIVKEAKNNGVSAQLVDLFFDALNVIERQAIEDAGIALNTNDEALSSGLTEADEQAKAAAEDLAKALKEIEGDADSLFKQVGAKLNVAAA